MVIFGTLALAILCRAGLRIIHDRIKHSHAELTGRFIDLVGRMSALLIGTIAMDMIITGATSSGLL